MAETSRYREIADELRRRIMAGEFPVGSALPSISALQTTYGVPALNTIRQAQELLRDEGLIETVQGKGSFVVSLTPAGPDEPAYAELPPIDDDLAAAMDKARERLLKQAQGFYLDGYRQGVELAGQLDWTQLDWIIKQGGIVAAATSISDQLAFHDHHRIELPPGARARSMIERGLLITYVGNHVDHTGSIDWAPHEVTIEGMDRALRDLWDQVRSPIRPRPTPQHADDGTAGNGAAESRS